MTARNHVLATRSLTWAVWPIIVALFRLRVIDGVKAIFGTDVLLLFPINETARNDIGAVTTFTWAVGSEVMWHPDYVALLLGGCCLLFE